MVCACFSGAFGVCVGFLLAYITKSEAAHFPFYIVWISAGLCCLLGFFAKESFVTALIEVVLGLLH